MVGKFVMQWHIGEQCNLKCLHCYQENHVPVQLSYNQLLDILNQYRQLLKQLNVRGHINLTGGEPLCSPHFYRLLEEFKKDTDLYSFSILTNGTLITEDVARKIASYNPEYVQVSLEGGRRVNDYIRGKGVYSKVTKAIKYLKNAGIFVSVSFTATRINYKEFPKLVRFAKRHSVDNVWSDRYIPLGNNHSKSDCPGRLDDSGTLDLTMTKEETQEYLSIMAEQRSWLNRKNKATNKNVITNMFSDTDEKLSCSNNSTTVAMYRALQFLYTNDYAYRCTAGDSLLTVMENGDLVPCRRMPIVVGNLLKENMYDLYMNNSVLKSLRQDTTPDDCKSCEHSHFCKGGLKCLTYAIYGDLNHKDVGCGLDLNSK